MDVLAANDIHKRYGTITAVDGIDLAVARGEVVAMLGPNGAGKTTTIEMLLGLRRPDSGTVRVFGQRPDATAVRARVGAMLQDTHLPDSTTVTELIDLVGRYYPYALPVDDVLARAGLAPRRRARVGELSGGQRQRLSFALAIAGDPDLLFLDEPTVAMDVDGRRAFWQQVRGLAGLGKTVLFSTHYLAEADAFADRIVVIHRGRILTDGPPAAIKALVAAKTVRVTTDAPVNDVRDVAGVEHVAVDGASAHRGAERLVVHTSAPERLLAALMSGGRTVDDLTVVDADLEAAFVHLTHTEQEVAA